MTWAQEKRRSTLSQWNDRLEHARKQLEESKQCYELFGDEDSRRWVEEDQKKVDQIKKQIETVKAYLDKHYPQASGEADQPGSS